MKQKLKHNSLILNNSVTITRTILDRIVRLRDSTIFTIHFIYLFFAETQSTLFILQNILAPIIRLIIKFCTASFNLTRPGYCPRSSTGPGLWTRPRICTIRPRTSTRPSFWTGLGACITRPGPGMGPGIRSSFWARTGLSRPWAGTGWRRWTRSRTRTGSGSSTCSGARATATSS